MRKSLFAVVVIAGCAAPADSSWCATDHDDVPAAFSTGPGIWEVDGLSPRLEEVWRAGGLREGEQLAVPVAATASAQARVAIADFRLGEVVVIGADGTWLGPWGARGEGPGEVSMPVATMWDRRSEILAVLDFGRARTIFFEDGEPTGRELAFDPAPLAPIFLAGELPWAGVQPSGNVLIQLPPTIEAGDVLQSAVLRIPTDGGSADTLATGRTRAVGGSSEFAELPSPGWPRLMTAVGTLGEIVLGGLDARYRLLVLDDNGDLVRLICRDSPAVALESREFGSPERILQKTPPPDSLASYGRIFVGARGRIWVQRARPSPVVQADSYGVPGSAFDIFDSEGRYLGEVRAPPRARLQAAAGDTAWAFEIGDLDETWLVAYQLTGLK